MFVKQSGKKITEQQFKSWVGKSKWLTQIKNSVELGNSFVDNGIPALNAAAVTLDVTSDALNIFPGVKTFAGLAGIIDKFMSKREHDKNLDSHAEIRDELNKRLEERNYFELEKFLPFLFAQDVADWMELSGNKLIIFLETYELLEGAVGSRLEAHNLYRDWWVRGDNEGLIFYLPDTLWVISGRNELNWKGELAEEIKPNLLEPLTQEDSLEFLTKAKVEPPELREEIFKLTEGYPLYLDVCVDFYEQYLSKNGTAPPIAEFGTKREKIIERLMKYADSDLRLMIDGLAILGMWTDELASKIVYGYEPTVYRDDAKKFSFIHAKQVPLDDDKLEVFHFDRTLQKFIVDAIKADEDLSWLIDETLTAADKFFEPLLDGREVIDETFCFYIKLWADLIVNLTDDAELLQTRYEEKLFGHVRNMIDVYKITTAQNIIESFWDKVEEVAGEENIPCAYFAGEFSKVMDERGEYEEATFWAEFRYEKYSKLLGKKHPETVDALITLSFLWKTFGEFGISEELCEELLESTKEVFGENSPETTFVMENLAEIFNSYGRHEQALELEEKVLKFRREHFGEENDITVYSMGDMAVMLMKFEDRLDEALTLQEKVVNYFKENYGENYKSTIGAMLNLANVFRKMGRYEEALTLQEENLKLSKETFGEKHPLTITAISNLASTLSYLDREEESLKLTEQAFNLRKEVIGKGHIDTMKAMFTLADRLQKVGRHQEAAALWKEFIGMIFVPDEGGDIRAYIDSKFDATDEDDLYGAWEVLNPMIHLAKALIDAGEKDAALSWADHALKLGEKIFPVLIADKGEVYTNLDFTGMDFEKNLSELRAWHELFLKKFNGENPEDFDKTTTELLKLIKHALTYTRYEEAEED